MGSNWDRKGRGWNEINVHTWQDSRSCTNPHGAQLAQEGKRIESNKCTHMARYIKGHIPAHVGPNWDRKGRGLNQINVHKWQDIRPRTGPCGVQLGQEVKGIESNKNTHIARYKATYQPTWCPTGTGREGDGIK